MAPIRHLSVLFPEMTWNRPGHFDETLGRSCLLIRGEIFQTMIQNVLHRIAPVLSLMFLLALLFSCGEGNSGSSDPSLRPVSQIAFETDKGTNGEIYVTSAGGGNAANLTNNLKNDIDAAWDPNGGQIAFSSNRLLGDEVAPYYRVYVMTADGSAATRISENERIGFDDFDDYAPVWSPDGLRFAFLSNRKPVPNTNPEDFVVGDEHLWVMDADGTNQSEIEWPNSHRLGTDFDPAWSPDSARIAFQSLRIRDRNNEIYLWDVDAAPPTNPTNLSNDPASDAAPAWSPNGTQIAFESDRSGDWEIYIMNADGTNPTNFTNNPGADDRSAAWSPDGTRITYESIGLTNAQDPPKSEIYVKETNGGPPYTAPEKNLTNNPASDKAPAWSPDGSQITFESFRDGVWQIYIMNADGSSPTNITNNPAQDAYAPAWRP